MSLLYRLMYRIGFTPWDTGQVPRELSALVEGGAGVTVDWLKADVAELGGLGLEPGFAFAFDRGCFHGLGDSERAAYAAGVTAIAAPGASLLVMAFGPNRVPAAPAGVEETEIVARFDGWDLAGTQPDSEREIAGPLRNVPRHWYRLIRR